MIIDFKTRFDLGHVAYYIESDIIYKIKISTITFILDEYNEAELIYNGKFKENELLDKQEIIELINKEE